MYRLVITARTYIPSEDRIIPSAKVAIPYEPGFYDFAYDFPFVKDMWLGDFEIYSFGRLTINEDYSIEYLDEVFTIPLEGVYTVEKAFVYRTFRITFEIFPTEDLL